MKYDDTQNPLSRNYRPRSNEVKPRKPSAFEEFVSAVFGGLFVGVLSLAVVGFFLSLLYGVVILIFRHAYGIELPNPFTWLGIGWFKK